MFRPKIPTVAQTVPGLFPRSASGVSGGVLASCRGPEGQQAALALTGTRCLVEQCTAESSLVQTKAENIFPLFTLTFPSFLGDFSPAGNDQILFKSNTGKSPRLGC